MKRGTPPYVYPKGRKGYLFFVRGGVCQRIKPALGSADFAAEYALLLRGKAAPSRTTFKALMMPLPQPPEVTP